MCTMKFVCVLYLLAGALAKSCAKGSDCEAEKDASVLLQSSVKTHHQTDGSTCQQTMDAGCGMLSGFDGVLADSSGKCQAGVLGGSCDAINTGGGSTDGGSTTASPSGGTTDGGSDGGAGTGIPNGGGPDGGPDGAVAAPPPTSLLESTGFCIHPAECKLSDWCCPCKTKFTDDCATGLPIIQVKCVIAKLCDDSRVDKVWKQGIHTDAAGNCFPRCTAAQKQSGCTHSGNSQCTPSGSSSLIQALAGSSSWIPAGAQDDNPVALDQALAGKRSC